MDIRVVVATLVMLLTACGLDLGDDGAPAAPPPVPQPRATVATPDAPMPSTSSPATTAGGAGNAAEAPAVAPQPASTAPTDTLEPGAEPVTEVDPTELDPETGEAPPLAFDECDLDSGWAGDEYCILPPPPDRGFQVRIGPSDYDNPDPRYVIEPGQETNLYFDAVSGNDQPVHFYYRQYRLRPGTHHLVLTEQRSGLGNDAGSGRRLGGSQNLIKDIPDRGVIAPENAGVGVPLEANVPLSVNLHYINTTDQPIVQEAWINVWYKDEAEVTEVADEMFLLGSVSFAVQPFETTTLGPYGCEVEGSGRLLTMYGHRHANAPRFTAWRVRGGERQLIYESLDWAEPLFLEFNSMVDNTPADPATGIEGGHSGILDLEPGDRLEWECHVVNESDGVLRFSNETYDGEMCILIGDTAGTRVSCSPS